MSILTLNHLSKTYPGAARPALDQLSLTLPSGSLTALLGPSGCGKTTAMKLIAGLLDPTSGDIALDGQSILSLPPDRRGTVMVFQNHLLFPFMTLAENVSFGLRMRRLPATRIARETDAMLARVHLTGLGDRRPADLSGGQQQRAALARALILRPKLLLLDEPLSNLDAHLRGEMRALILDLHRDTGITTLVVTHDQQEAVVMADQIALILDGKLRQSGPPATFYTRPADAEVARFFGGVNFILGHAGAGLFHSPLGPLRLPDGAPPGKGTLTIRPEAIRLDSAAPDSRSGNSLTVTVTDRSFLGTQTRLGLVHGTTRLEALVTPAEASLLQIGQPVTVILPPAALWVLPG